MGLTGRQGSVELQGERCSVLDSPFPAPAHWNGSGARSRGLAQGLPAAPVCSGPCSTALLTTGCKNLLQHP